MKPESQLKLLQLQTQLVVTEMNLFEVYALSILEHFQAFFDHVITGYSKVLRVKSGKEKDQILFVDTYEQALLKASVSIVQIFLKFLNSSQLEDLISNVIQASQQPDQGISHVNAVLETISLEAKSHQKLIVQATFNAYTRVIEDAIGQADFMSNANRFFGELLHPMITSLPQSFIQSHSQKFLKFFKTVFALPFKLAKDGLSLDVTIQEQIVDCFSSFVIKLSEEQLRPIILSLTKWAMKTKEDKEFNHYKVIMLCKLLTGVLNTLKEFFVPLFPIYFEPMIVHVLNVLITKLKGSSAKRSRAEMESDVPHDTVETLLTEVCLTLQMNFKFDTNAFIQNDTYEILCDPVADLVTLLKITDFAKFVEKTVKPLVHDMDERINDDNMWQRLNYAILMKTRSEAWQTRLASLQIIEHLFDTMRERYLVILNDTIPFISELLEDENEKVESSAKRIVQRIEQLTGESINDYLK